MPSGPFANLRHWPLPYASANGQRRGKWLQYGNARHSTALIDFDTWPPAPIIIDNEYISSFDVQPDGRLIVCSMLTKPASDYRVRVHSPSGWTDKSAQEPANPIPAPLPGGLCEVWMIGNQVIVFDSNVSQHHPPETKHAYTLEDGCFQVVSALPEIQAFDPERKYQQYVSGKVTLADGTDVLIWDGDGYEIQPDGLQRTWQLGVQNSFIDWTAVRWGADGFFCLSNRQMMYAKRGTTPTRFLPDADNIMFLSPGPNDSIIASRGQNLKALAASVWFPASGSYIPITRKDLAIPPRQHPRELYWSATTRHFYTRFGGLLTFPDSDLLARKLVRPRGAGYIV
jgi:hypothetical protein